jgi:hypothetical protein
MANDATKDNDKPRVVKVDYRLAMPLLEIVRDRAGEDKTVYTVEYFGKREYGFGFEVTINGNSATANPLSSGKQGMRTIGDKIPFNYFRYPSKLLMEDGKPKIHSMIGTAKFDLTSVVDVVIQKREGSWGMVIRRDDPRCGRENFISFDPPIFRRF